MLTTPVRLLFFPAFNLVDCPSRVCGVSLTSTILRGSGVEKMAQSIDTWRDLLENKKSFAHVATLMPDGTPQSTPVWVDYRNGKVLVNSARGRVKVRNLKAGSPVAISITDPDNPYRYVQIRGMVSRVTEEGASEHIDKMAKKYLGKDK